MLSEAKHLQCLLENTQMQILRFAQADNPDGLFPQPVQPRRREPGTLRGFSP